MFAVFLIRCRCYVVVTGVLDKVRVFRISCGCIGVVEGVLGVGEVVLDTVRVFWSGCRCSR